MRKNTYEPATHAETNRTESRRLLHAMTQSQISTPVEYYVKEPDFRSERLYHMTKRLHIAPESDIQMQTTIYSEPSQPNPDGHPRVADELVSDTTNCPIVINYTPQMNIANCFTKALPESQYDQLHHYFVSTDSLKAKTS